VESPEEQQLPLPGPVVASRFSPFSTPGTQRASIESNAIPPAGMASLSGPDEMTKRSSAGSALRRELERKASSTSSVWSSSTGASQTTVTATEAPSGTRGSISGTRATSMVRGTSDSSDASFQSDRVSLFRHKLSIGLFPSTRTSASTRSSKPYGHQQKSSWELLDEAEVEANKRAASLVKARLGRASLDSTRV
jgi:hypothetical protein